MRRIEDNNYTRKGKHLSWEERIQIETLQREGLSTTLIGNRLQRSARTIRREINRGWVLHRTGKYTVEHRYSADRGQSVYEARMSAKTKTKEIDTTLIEYLQAHIIKGKESPAVAAFKMKKEALEFAVCTKTIYNLINRGLIDGVSNETLWEKPLRNKKKKKIYRQRKKTITPEHSIENRPAVVRAMDGIERQMEKEHFRTVFKSIIADNRSEFLGYEALERSICVDNVPCRYLNKKVDG